MDESWDWVFEKLVLLDFLGVDVNSYAFRFRVSRTVLYDFNDMLRCMRVVVFEGCSVSFDFKLGWFECRVRRVARFNVSFLTFIFILHIFNGEFLLSIFGWKGGCSQASIPAFSLFLDVQ
jgi:hypothetical protein